MTRASVTNIESGRQKMSVHTLIAFAASLDVSPARLIMSLDPDTLNEIEALVPEGSSDSVKRWIMAGASKAHDVGRR